jgi:surface antigen
VNRTVGATLRLTVGGGAIFAFGFGALASVPQPPLTASASAAAAVVPLVTPVEHMDEPVPHQARAAAVIYVLATPEPTPTVAPRQAVVARPMARSAASVPSAAMGPASGAASGFSYGYCTWWVAQKRYIPWRGNAAEWWWNARPFGFAEGATPRVGAVMVMGVSGTSPQGHVAYVESVNPDGSFVVSEMNWWGVAGGGWNRVDYRTVTSMRGILGFIY